MVSHMQNKVDDGCAACNMDASATEMMLMQFFAWFSHNTKKVPGSFPDGLLSLDQSRVSDRHQSSKSCYILSIIWSKNQDKFHNLEVQE